MHDQIRPISRYLESACAIAASAPAVAGGPRWLRAYTGRASARVLVAARSPCVNAGVKIPRFAGEKIHQSMLLARRPGTGRGGEEIEEPEEHFQDFDASPRATRFVVCSTTCSISKLLLQSFKMPLPRFYALHSEAKIKFRRALIDRLRWPLVVFVLRRPLSPRVMRSVVNLHRSFAFRSQLLEYAERIVRYDFEVGLVSKIRFFTRILNIISAPILPRRPRYTDVFARRFRRDAGR